MSTAQPMFATDEILWYDNGKWGEVGYAIANPSGKIWTNNRMREGQARWGWKDKVAAAARAVATGLAFKLNPLDPFPALIDEAIHRAAEQQRKDAA